MRICYIADARTVHTARWVTHFANKGCEVHLISIEPSWDNNLGGVKLYVLKKFGPQIRFISFPANLLSLSIQVRKLVKKINPDILHAHYITDNGFLGALSGFHPLVLTAWGSDILVDPKRSPLHKMLIKYLLREADLVTTQGKNMIKEMISLGADHSKMRVIHFGVDIKNFSPKDKNHRQERESPGASVVISTRNLKPIYDVETLIRSAPLVLEQIPDVKFVIIGEGVQEDYLMNLARSMGVLNNVRFIGTILHDKVPHYLRSADVYVSTSLSDSGSSVSLPEAMACGLSVVATNVGDVSDWIDDRLNGFVIPIKRPEILAEKIVYLLKNKELRHKMGRANRALVEERASYKREMDKMIKLYEEVLVKRNPD